MIEGHAEEKNTADFAARHRPVQYKTMGASNLTASQAGFGCYRVSIDVKHHENAMRKALTSGINIVDTSTNYANGGSEKLVGKVLDDMISEGALSRQEVIVVSKAGYLQGENYALSQERKHEGNAFKELVTFGKEMEHCIHPDFLNDQLARSLDRLNLETLDFLLLHNPEYYLEWAIEQGDSINEAREEYYRRIQNAFEYLEKEVNNGRIRAYGISSNTFTASSDASDFTSLDKVWSIAESISENHHFQLVQFPLNLMEVGAVLEKNQQGDHNILQYSESKNLAVLINRPLNAFSDNKLIRLADIEAIKRQDRNEIIKKIRALAGSEKKLWMKILPKTDLLPGLTMRIKEQIAIGDHLKHYHLNFGSYEKWRQARDNFYLPRVQGVMDFLKDNTPHMEEITNWMADYQQVMENAFRAVASFYTEAAQKKANRMKESVNNADADWSSADTLSQKAFRCVRSTKGVSSVLVGMRKNFYVDDILKELHIPVPQKSRVPSWKKVSSDIHENI